VEEGGESAGSAYPRIRVSFRFLLFVSAGNSQEKKKAIFWRGRKRADTTRPCGWMGVGTETFAGRGLGLEAHPFT